MIWRQPAAWFGLVRPWRCQFSCTCSDAGARHRCGFLTLRFLDVSPHRAGPTPSAERRALLLVRLAIVAAAVAALAGPVFVAEGPRNPDTIARAIVVDTSPSMSRLTSAGTDGPRRAQARAQSLTASTSASRS